MKRALALLVGIIFSLSVTPVSALEPVSQHYVGKTLERIAQADLGSGGAQGDVNFPLVFMEWLEMVAEALLVLVDTEVTIIEAEENLREDTACLHADMTIIKNKIGELKDQLQKAFEDHDIERIMKTQSMIRFLGTRLRHLVRGARDPAYRDEGWHERTMFDPPAPVWCCMDATNTCEQKPQEECTQDVGRASNDTKGCEVNGCPIPDPPEEKQKQEMCPVDTDYLPPTLEGYGCDEEVMQSLTEISSIDAEYQALTKLVEESTNFAAQMEETWGIWQVIIEMIRETTGEDPTSFIGELVSDSPFNPLLREHQRRYGCDLAEGPDAAEEEGWPEGAIRWELRGPFSLEKDEIHKIPEKYVTLRREWGEKRPQADHLKVPSEYLEGPEQDKAQEDEKSMTMLDKLFRWYYRVYFKIFNIEQGGKEAEIAPKAIDAYAQTTEALKPLREAVRTFATVSADIDTGLRGFARNFAYFLRRTCTFRPCNLRLDQTLKIIFADACFPYGLDPEGEVNAECKCSEESGVEPQDGLAEECEK